MRVTSPQLPLLISVPFINPTSYRTSDNLLSLTILSNPNLIRSRSSSYSATPPGAGKFNGAENFRFDFNDEEDGSASNRKRVWWSDDSLNCDDDADDDERGGGFGVLQDSFDTSFILKVFNAFGWMVPAVAISMLLGTGGSNTFLMALVLPLAQSVVSFIADRFFGSSVRGPKSKRKGAKKKPFYRARNSTEMKQDANTREVNENYQYREETKNRPLDRRGSSFGGWDELDKELESYKVPKREPTRKTSEPWLEKKGKLSKRVRTRGTPLLVRLLIAVFPFLGSWTRLL